MGLFEQAKTNARWAPAYFWQRVVRKAPRLGSFHLLFCLADHFEPSIIPSDGRARAEKTEQERRLEVWCKEIPRALDRWRDGSGRPFYHTYFYPAEQYDADLIDRLAEHCKAGWGEIEIHLHHGMDAPDTRAHTEQEIVQFRDALAYRHESLSRWDGKGPARYAFVHGNFALANVMSGWGCGVNDEMQLLADTGCYADLTMASAPHPTQVTKINSIYECGLPLNQRAPHRRGRNLRAGRQPAIFPLMIQGPLMLDFSRVTRKRRFPCIDNGALTGSNPPTMHRLQLWRQAAIAIEGRPDWLFIKLHCHGMDPRDRDAMYGASGTAFLRELLEESKQSQRFCVHFTTAREMTNIILAACDGREGNPSNYRDYRLKKITGDHSIGPMAETRAQLAN